jgi:hypothetical protein
MVININIEYGHINLWYGPFRQYNCQNLPSINISQRCLLFSFCVVDPPIGSRAYISLSLSFLPYKHPFPFLLATFSCLFLWHFSQFFSLSLSQHGLHYMGMWPVCGRRPHIVRRAALLYSYIQKRNEVLIYSEHSYDNIILRKYEAG